MSSVCKQTGEMSELAIRRGNLEPNPKATLKNLQKVRFKKKLERFASTVTWESSPLLEAAKMAPSQGKIPFLIFCGFCSAHPELALDFVNLQE